MLGWLCRCLDKNQETHRQGIKMRCKKKILPQVRIRFYHAWPPGEEERNREKRVMIRHNLTIMHTWKRTRCFVKDPKAIYSVSPYWCSLLNDCHDFHQYTRELSHPSKPVDRTSDWGRHQKQANLLFTLHVSHISTFLNILKQGLADGLQSKH